MTIVWIIIAVVVVGLIIYFLSKGKSAPKGPGGPGLPPTSPTPPEGPTS